MSKSKTSKKSPIYVLKGDYNIDAIVRLNDEQRKKLKEILSGIEGLESVDPDLLALIEEKFDSEREGACTCQGQAIPVGVII